MLNSLERLESAVKYLTQTSFENTEQISKLHLKHYNIKMAMQFFQLQIQLISISFWRHLVAGAHFLTMSIIIFQAGICHLYVSPFVTSSEINIFCLCVLHEVLARSRRRSDDDLYGNGAGFNNCRLHSLVSSHPIHLVDGEKKEGQWLFMKALHAYF